MYKAASEGIMNLADKFFEMERAQALQVGTCTEGAGAWLSGMERAQALRSGGFRAQAVQG